eukprot:CAMPEP_0118861434 /NCGR_PEP_ID=MMETSP1163-20130328/6968_1 /TAXON_ID=124430 /ORGANISM="Phaeomonas parva, Strain CCMP2877" /LENGTH=98 /DNA_ID=CAMNT_0006795247 /DNA_START=245 /DNA_END=537 /DNA_ORIENTATION=+
MDSAPVASSSRVALGGVVNADGGVGVASREPEECSPLFRLGLRVRSLRLGLNAALGSGLGSGLGSALGLGLGSGLGSAWELGLGSRLKRLLVEPRRRA